ncbi:uncharacterized protein [Macrobrachium rosenbergii]|uniref:uncharacterized protein n=1 Tax=Macrobrachium rosenbergii TaxID=79674 RepID=UPI0034D514F6
MKADIKKWMRECLPCQMSKIMWDVESIIGEFHTMHCCLAHIHLDIVDPLPNSEGYRCLFTINDRNTRWPEAILIWQQIAESCVKALIGWVSIHEVQQIITSHRGANFTSSLWNSLADSWGQS